MRKREIHVANLLIVEGIMLHAHSHVFPGDPGFTGDVPAMDVNLPWRGSEQACDDVTVKQKKNILGRFRTGMSRTTCTILQHFSAWWPVLLSYKVLWEGYVKQWLAEVIYSFSMK